MLFLSLEFDKIIKPSLFLTEKLFNIHFSLLPKYKGMYTSYWPIINAESETGVTLHRIDQGIDTGNIIQQSSFRINSDMTVKQLYLQYIKSGTKLIKDNFLKLMDDRVKEESQSYKDSSYYSNKSIDFNITE